MGEEGEKERGLNKEEEEEEGTILTCLESHPLLDSLIT